MSPFIIVAILLSGVLAHIPFNDVILEVAVHSMIRQVKQTYFGESPCIVFISEKSEPLTDIVIDDLPVMRIIVGGKPTDVLYIEDNNTTDTYALGKGAQAFDHLLHKTLDARCIGYIVQIPNPKAIVHSFSRTVARTVQRVPRSYVFLPSVETRDMDKFAEEVLSLKDLDLMPNILIAKIHTNIPVAVSLEEGLSLRNLYCDDTSPQDQQRDRTENAVQQGRKFIGNLSLSFKENKNKHMRLSYPKLTKQYDANNMFIAIEIVTQCYAGLNPSEEVFLDMWMQFRSEGFFVLCANLYPDKILDLQGKPLTAIAIPYDPFVIMYHYNDPPIHDGLEFFIFRELVNKFNGTMRVIYDPENFWGSIFENGTGYGIVGAVLSGQADAGFAAMYTEWYYEWADYGIPHCQSSPILVVPRSKLIPAYTVPVLPFSPGTWAAVLLSVLGISIFMCCLSAALHKFLPGFTKGRASLSRTFLDTTRMFVLQFPNKESEELRYCPWKHFLTTAFIYFLLITSAYRAGLASLLALPRSERPIETLSQLAAADIKWMFPYAVVSDVFQREDNPILNAIADKFLLLPPEEITTLALKGNDAVLIEEIAGGAFSYGPYINTEAMSKLRLMKEPVALYHVSMITRKGGPLTKPLGDLILALNQGGLEQYCQEDVVRRFLSSRLQLQITLSRTEVNFGLDTPRILQLSHVLGALMFLAIGLATAAVVFVTELAVHEYKKKRH